MSDQDPQVTTREIKLSAKIATQATQIAALEAKLKIFLEWDEAVDECFEPSHAELKERVAALEAALTSLPVWGTYSWQEAAKSVRLKLKENAAQIVSLMHERDDAKAALAPYRALASVLEASKIPHLVVDGDCWFSCPKSGECCRDDQDKTKCECGADVHNKRIDDALAHPAIQRAVGKSDDPYQRRPNPGPCACGLREIPSGVDGVQWYWQRHAREGCTLELPNHRCSCGLLRSEHLEGHQRAVTEGMMRLKARYSGDLSRLFWKRVNALPSPHKEALYSCGVLLQEMESRVLNWLNADELLTKEMKERKP